MARTIAKLEQLHETNSQQNQQIESLRHQLEAAKKAGEDTAQKLKEVMFNQGPSTKQVCYVVSMLTRT